ncbi:MAG TPA: hypothetical protein VF720_16605 [Candidatus Eisenbacteria bacterium]
MSNGRMRRTFSAALGVLGVLLVVVAVMLGFARRVLFDERAFSARVAASLEDSRVAGWVAERLADGVIAVQPDLVGVRPLLVGVGRGIVISPPFRAAARRTARTAHRALMSGTGQDILLTVKDVGVVLSSAVSEKPAIAGKIPPKLAASIGALKSLPGGERAMRLVQFAHRLRAGAIALFLAGIGLCVLSVRLAEGRRVAIVRIGTAFAVAGLVMVIGARFGGDLLSLFARDESAAPALAGLGRAFLRPLVVWGFGLGFSGLVFASAAASLLERVSMEQWARDTQGWLFGAQHRMWLRMVRGLVGLAIGAAILSAPLASLTVFAWLAGVVIAFAGLREAFHALLHTLPEVDRTAARRAPGTPGRLAVGVIGLVAVAVIATTAWLVLRTSHREAVAGDLLAVNGLPELRDRTIDQVVFPGTHNAMGSPDIPGWMFPNQGADIRAQLGSGIRAFMLDALYAAPVGDRVKTEMKEGAPGLAKYQAAIGAEGMDAAIRIRERLVGSEEGERDVYMCHGFCELGARKLADGLEDMHDFLVENPDEVLILIIQDVDVAPADIARCFEESGLIDFVYRGPLGPPWPTLRSMVESNQQVIVFAENDWAGIDWYHPAFETFQETPYTFHEPDQFSNKPNRGGTGGSLYLMNHWIETTPMPKPTNAEIVNAHDFLLARIEGFEKERRHLPNIVAVDFFQSGDLVAVTRELNLRPVDEPLPKKGRRR